MVNKKMKELKQSYAEEYTDLNQEVRDSKLSIQIPNASSQNTSYNNEAKAKSSRAAQSSDLSKAKAKQPSQPDSTTRRDPTQTPTSTDSEDEDSEEKEGADHVHDLKAFDKKNGYLTHREF